jgi:galactose mutarotase-like enzyme
MTAHLQQLTIAAGDATASISRRGAELIAWRVAGRDLIWHGDPVHWSGRAPILFPVVGASAGGQVTVDGRDYPMPQHGFARNVDFAVVEHGSDRAVLRLESSSETQKHYPFAFRLEVHVDLAPDAVHLRFIVLNPGDKEMPYALGYHPAFPWPFDRGDRNGHVVLFDAIEEPAVPSITAAGLLDPALRSVPLNGRRLPLDPDLFDKGALVFRNARSRRMRFVSPSGAAIALQADPCAHLALWTKPQAPFLSMEAWTGHADWTDRAHELRDRHSMRFLKPGETAEIAMSLHWIDATGGA